MRTRTNLYIGEAEEGFLKIMKNFYPEGTVEIVFDGDADGVEKLTRLLKKSDYNVVLTEADKYNGREYFAVAIGKDSFRKVRKKCKGKFCSYVKFIVIDMFAQKEKYAEFLYLDEREYNYREKTAECYTALLCAVAEGLGCFYHGKNYPFAEKGLKRLLQHGIGVLLGEADGETFVKESLGLSKEIVEKLSVSGVENFTVVNMAEKLGGSVGDYAESACFLNRTLILFTKWDFRDMLITVERLVEDVKIGYPAYGEEDLILKEGDLAKILRFVTEYRSRNGLYRLIKSFGQSVNGNDVAFAEIYNRGIYEGILNYG